MAVKFRRQKSFRKISQMGKKIGYFLFEGCIGGIIYMGKVIVVKNRAKENCQFD